MSLEKMVVIMFGMMIFAYVIFLAESSETLRDCLKVHSVEDCRKF